MCVCVCVHMCACAFLHEFWDHRCAFLVPFQGILWGCSAGGCYSHPQTINVPFLTSCSGQLPHSPSARRHKEKGESGNNQRPRMSISTSVTQAQSLKDSCRCPRSLQKALGGACWLCTMSAPRGQEAQQTTEHMNQGTESHPSVVRQLEETQFKCFAHALKRPKGWSPFVVLETAAVFQKEVIYQLKLRLQALFHLTSL